MSPLTSVLHPPVLVYAGLRSDALAVLVVGVVGAVEPMIANDSTTPQIATKRFGIIRKRSG